MILVAGFYGSSIGQERMFRYHYMEMIEERISEIVPTGNRTIALGWNRFSSRLITANIHHLTNRGARRHYVHFALALVSLVIGCVLLSLLLLLTGSVEKVGVRALAAPVSDIRNQLIS